MDNELVDIVIFRLVSNLRDSLITEGGPGWVIRFAVGVVFYIVLWKPARERTPVSPDVRPVEMP